jgi:hypothetical protein
MISHGTRVKLFLAVMAVFLTFPVPSSAAEKIWGSYENEIDGDRVSLSIRPSGGDENSRRAVIIFHLLEKDGNDLEIDAAGTVKGQTAILYSYHYRLTVTIRGDKADFLVEESCGGHRFYDGYGYYNETCRLGSYKSLAKLSKGLKKL